MIFSTDSTMASAPTLTGAAGGLKTLLATLLTTGFASGSVTSLVVADGIATATVGTGHPYRAGRAVLIAGATPSGLNGNKRVLSATGTAITFDATGIAAGTATGTITHKVAHPGWTEAYTGTNLTALKPSALEATGHVLRVDDTGTTNSRVRAYESMSAISTGVGPIPLEAQVSGGLYWPKSGTADSTERPWFCVADARGFYLAVAPQGGDRFTLMYAGDIASLKSGDAYGHLLTGNEADQVAATTAPGGCCGYSGRSARGGAYLSRAHTGVGQALAAQRLGAHHNGSTADVYAGSAGYSVGSYPNGANNGLMTGALELYGLGLRGSLPGLLHPVQDCGNAFASGALVQGTDDLAGRTLMAIRTAPPSGSVVAGTVFIDVTGPWAR